MSSKLSGVANIETLVNVLDALPLGLFWKDRESTYQGCNVMAAKGAGLPDAGAITGKTDFDFFTHDQAIAIRTDDRDVIDDGAPKLGIVERVTSPEADRWIEINKVPLRDARGDIVGLVGAFRDITEQVRLQNERIELIAQLTSARDAAESASRAKSNFLANMSHELRTPLNAIIGYAEILAEDVVEGEVNAAEAEADLQRIVSAARHLLGLITDILDISKIESGKETVHIGRFEVAPFLQDVVAMVAPAAAVSGNQIVVRMGKEFGCISTDDRKLRQCVLNLVANANKFTTNGTVEIFCDIVNGSGMPKLLIEVRDTGIGIAKEKLAGLFQPFAQADASVTRRFGGTGLGLAITQQLARLLGGDVTAESVEGIGSKFSLSIPVRLELARAA